MKEPLTFKKLPPRRPRAGALAGRIGLILLALAALALLLFLSGCATRPLYDAAGAAAGGGLGYALSDGDPLYTVGGAAGGVLVSEYLQSQGEKSRLTAYNRGYDRGRSDGVKQQYWITQNAQKTAAATETPPRVRYYPVPAPAARDGSHQVPSEVFIPVAE
jgi:hypothetical protein